MKIGISQEVDVTNPFNLILLATLLCSMVGRSCSDNTQDCTIANAQYKI